MAQSDRLPPSELHIKCGSTGVLLIHGFTGSAAEMSRIGNHFSQQGLTVLSLLLPGHGTTPEVLNTKGWHDWVKHSTEALDRLGSECHTVFVAGLSLGALLAMYLAANHSSIRGVVAYSPPVPLAHPRSYLFPLKYVIGTLPKPKDYFADADAEAQMWNYEVAPLRAYYELLKFIRITRKELNKVGCPILVVHSTKDSVIHAKSAKNVLDGVGSIDKELLTLEEGGHVVTMDVEWERVAEKTLDFIRRHGGQN